MKILTNLDLSQNEIQNAIMQPLGCTSGQPEARPDLFQQRRPDAVPVDGREMDPRAD